MDAPFTELRTQGIDCGADGRKKRPRRVAGSLMHRVGNARGVAVSQY